jgi:hypothetical protein
MTAITDPGGLIPARPLAAQAHALRAAAQFIERTGLAGLSVTADAHGIGISVPARFGGPAARIAAVTFLAAVLGSQPVRRQTRAFALISAAGQIAGHDAQVITSIDVQEQAP